MTAYKNTQDFNQQSLFGFDSLQDSLQEKNSQAELLAHLLAGENVFITGINCKWENVSALRFFHESNHTANTHLIKAGSFDCFDLIEQDDVLIFCNVSKANRYFLSKSSDMLATRFDNNLPFGGLQVVFVGDFIAYPQSQATQMVSQVFDLEPGCVYLSDLWKQLDLSVFFFDYTEFLPVDIQPVVKDFYAGNINVTLLEKAKIQPDNVFRRIFFDRQAQKVFNRKKTAVLDQTQVFEWNPYAWCGRKPAQLTDRQNKMLHALGIDLEPKVYSVETLFDTGQGVGKRLDLKDFKFDSNKKCYVHDETGLEDWCFGISGLPPALWYSKHCLHTFFDRDLSSRFVVDFETLEPHDFNLSTVLLLGISLKNLFFVNWQESDFVLSSEKQQMVAQLKEGFAATRKKTLENIDFYQSLLVSKMARQNVFRQKSLKNEKDADFLADWTIF